MNGRNMLAGLQGAMDGFRWGREIMGDTPEDRATRAAQVAAESKAAAQERKQQQDLYKFNTQEARLKSQAEETERHNQVGEANAAGNLGLNNARLKTEQEHYADGAAKRQADQMIAEDTLAQKQEAANYRRGAQESLGTFSAIMDGSATPEQVAQAKRFFPTLVQDAATNSAKLKELFGRAAPYVQAGNFKAADDLMSTPEAQDAVNAAFGPQIQRRVGELVDDGRFVVSNARSVGVVRSPDNKRLSLMVETTQEPTPEYRKYLEQQAAAAPDEASRNAVLQQLQPQVYSAPLTEGRIPVAQGGQQRWFSPEDFQNGVSLLDRIAETQRKHPEHIELIRAQLEGLASGSDAASGMKEANLNVDKLYSRRAREMDLKLQEERLKREGSGKDKDTTEQVANAWRGFIGRQMPDQNEEDASGERKRLADMQLAGEDIIRAAKGNISLGDVMQRVQSTVPRSTAEISGRVGSIVSGGGGASAGGFTSATGPKGEKIYWDGGKWIQIMPDGSAQVFQGR